MANILFDIDDTLFPSTEFSALARKNAVNSMISMGLAHSSDSVLKRLNAIIESKGSNYTRHFDDLCAELGVDEPARYVAAAVAAYHDTKTAIAPFPQVPLTLLKLKEKGHRLHVATVGSSIKQWDKLIRLRIALFFDNAFVSDDLGHDKSEEFYKEIIRRLGAAPRDCIMVGDREDRDILPAKAAGMGTVRIFAGKHAGVPTSADRSVKDFSDLASML
ncbi:MAG: HAD hydrolase-like protein [Candidatus Micrarchaeota archaeon]